MSQTDNLSPGTLYVVAVPIGNFDDITLRALQTLKTVDYVLCEDTRTTNTLLTHHNIKQTLISYRDQNHDRIYSKIIEDLKNGLNIALVSDNGTPTISDPGFRLIHEIRQGLTDLPAQTMISPITIPGPSAFVAALSVSGLPTDNVLFCGFLPKTASKRRSIIENGGNSESTLIFYESPYRINALLAEVYKILGDRKAFIIKDITKSFETAIYGQLSEITQQKLKEKGEYTVLIAKKGF